MPLPAPLCGLASRGKEKESGAGGSRGNYNVASGVMTHDLSRLA